MEDRIIILATLKLVDGKLSDLTKAVNELQAHCLKTEDGMLQYDWFLSTEDNTIKVFETYQNSEAVMFHFDNYKPFAPALNDSRVFIRLELFGNASEALLKRVKKASATHYSSIASLNKLS